MDLKGYERGPIKVPTPWTKGNLVAGDVMLAQKLALELFELDTLKIANKFLVDQYWA